MGRQTSCKFDLHFFLRLGSTLVIEFLIRACKHGGLSSHILNYIYISEPRDRDYWWNDTIFSKRHSHHSNSQGTKSDFLIHVHLGNAYRYAILSFVPHAWSLRVVCKRWSQTIPQIMISNCVKIFVKAASWPVVNLAV